MLKARTKLGLFDLQFLGQIDQHDQQSSITEGGEQVSK